MRKIVFLFVAFLACSYKPYPYIGHITRCFYVDENNISTLNQRASLYGEYLFEKIIEPISIDNFDVNPINGKANLKSSEEKQLFKGYVVTNLKTKQCFEFDSSQSAPKLLKTYPIKEKKMGMDLNVPDIIQSFDINADKIIKFKDSSNYILLKDTVYKAKGMPPGLPLHEVKIWVNKNLKDFPLSFSDILTKKYTGAIDRVVLTSEDSKTHKKMTVSFRFAFQPTLTDKELKLIEKYLTLSK